MTSVKIAYYCTSVSWGGLEMNQLRNAKWMKNSGESVVIFTIKNSPIHKATIKAEIPVITINQHRKYFDFKQAMKLKNEIVKQQISHLIIRDPKDMDLAAWTKKLTKNKLHLSYFMEMQLGIPKKDFFHNTRFKAFDIWSCPLPWLVQQVKSLTNYPAERIVQIPSGLDVQNFEKNLSKSAAREILKLPKTGVIFGLIGRFDQQKGQLLLLEAYQKLKSKNEVYILLLGEKTKNEADDYYSKIITKIDKYDLKNQVLIRPFMEETTYFYKSIDALVMASKSETFGMVTIEALASGTPVIGSNSGGTPEIIKHQETGLLFESENVMDLTEKLQLFLDKPDFDKHNIKIAAKRYDCHTILPQIKKALNLT